MLIPKETHRCLASMKLLGLAVTASILIAVCAYRANQGTFESTFIPFTASQWDENDFLTWQIGFDETRPIVNLGVRLLWLREQGGILRSRYLAGEMEVLNESSATIENGTV